MQHCFFWVLSERSESSLSMALYKSSQNRCISADFFKNINQIFCRPLKTSEHLVRRLRALIKPLNAPFKAISQHRLYIPRLSLLNVMLTVATRKHQHQKPDVWCIHCGPLILKLSVNLTSLLCVSSYKICILNFRPSLNSQNTQKTYSSLPWL